MRFPKTIITFFCLLIFYANVFGQSEQAMASKMRHIAETLKTSAVSLDYELVRSYRPKDEWETEDKKSLIQAHAYYTLLGKDYEKSCLIPDGTINVTILVFKEVESARRQIAEKKEYHLGNMSVNITEFDNGGFYLDDGNGFYAAVLQDSTVILFDDRSRKQEMAIKSLAKKVFK